MSRDRHHGVLPTTFCFAVYMFLLIHHGGSKCVYKTPLHLKKEGCVNNCPSVDQYPEECTDCVRGFYGSDCRRSCRENCLNGRCALLANGRAVNCTEGCVLGWRGLTCSTRCKRPCLECDRYTGDCVGQCRDGFCGRGCLQRCPYPFSKCDESCGSPRKQKMTQALEQTLEKSRIGMIDITHINNTHRYKEGTPRKLKMTSALGQTQGSYKEGLNANPCAEEFGNNCFKCNQCNECLEGYYGSKCNQTCIGNCQFDCDIDTGLCRTCKDGFHAENCLVPCSRTCFGKACKRSTGACNDGCSAGYCSPSTGCDKNCSCPNCDFETCMCSTSSSPETCSPKQGSSILIAYWIGSILNTVYLVIFIVIYNYKQKLWTSLNSLCNKTPESETNGAEGIAMVEVTGQKSPQTNTDSGSTTTSCCSPVQSTRRVFLGILVYVVLNVVVCAMIYVYM